MSDDDVTLFGKLKNKLIDSKQKVGRGRPAAHRQDGRPYEAPAARAAPGRDLAGARSRHPARHPDPRLAAVHRRRGRESRDLEVGRVHRPAEDHAHHGHPLRHRLVALRQQVGGRERPRPAEDREAQGRGAARHLPFLRHLHHQRATCRFLGRRCAAGVELERRAQSAGNMAAPCAS